MTNSPTIPLPSIEDTTILGEGKSETPPRLQPIATAPDLARVMVCGWQPRSGTCAGYWWWEEGMVSDGEAFGRTEATHWFPIALPDFPAHPGLTGEEKAPRSAALDELGALDGELLASESPSERETTSPEMEKTV